MDHFLAHPFEYGTVLMGVLCCFYGLAGLVKDLQMTCVGIVTNMLGGAVLTALGLLGVLGFVAQDWVAASVSLFAGINLIGHGTGRFAVRRADPDPGASRAFGQFLIGLGAFSLLVGIITAMVSIRKVIW